MSGKFQDFEEFWPFYVRQHRLEGTRQLHFLGTTLGLVCAAQGHPLDALIVAYGFAWISHFFVEKNRPATFTFPWQSFRADFRMYRLMLEGKMAAEVRRLGLDPTL